MNEQTHLILHGVLVKKHAAPEAIAALMGADLDTVLAQLSVATARGRVTEVQGKYLLTPAGRMIVESDYSRHYADARADQRFIAAHASFETLNHELKQLITDWQVVTLGGKSVANDHGDAAYDLKLIERLGKVHDRVVPILAAIAQVVPRYTRYTVKLEAALERAENGARAWVSEAGLDSYHTVWFELHEDLLRVLGRVRAE